MSIGKNHLRVDGFEKAAGKTRFCADIEIPGMLFGKIIRTTVPAGKLKRIRFDPEFDWSTVTVVTAEDIPGKNIIEIIKPDMPALVFEKFNYSGEPVALVAAESETLARQAAAKISLDTESTKAIFGIETIVNRHKNSHGDFETFYEYESGSGNVEKGFRDWDKIIESEYFTGAQEHAYLEPQCMMAIPEGGNKIRILGSMQCPYFVHPAIVSLLGKKNDDVIVQQAPTGGAFGGKEDFPSLLGAHVALLAEKSGRPVRIRFDREEDISFSTKRHPAWIRHKTGISKDGKLVSMDIEIILDAGAYATLSSVVLARALIHACGVYKCPNVKIRAFAAKSNLPPPGAFRGFGAPQVQFAVESHMDELAAACRISPLDIRRKNILRLGDKMFTGQKLTESVGGEACLEAVREMSDFLNRRVEIENENKTAHQDVKRGIGIATCLHGATFTGAGEKALQSRAALLLKADGVVEILTSITEMGQGALTTFSQIVSEALSIPTSSIQCLLPDTSRVPNSGPTVASRSTMIVGRILEHCSKDLIKAMEKAIGPGAGREGKGFHLASGKVIQWNDAAAIATKNGNLRIERAYDFPDNQIWDENTFQGIGYPVYSWGAVGIEIAVDVGTFEITPEKLRLVYEIGKAINPASVRGQLEGGSLQALGYGLLENMNINDGRFLQNRFQTYIIPTFPDLPKVKTRIIEMPYSRGPGGAKGVGELPMNAVAAALCNAVKQALGVNINSLPITPEKLFESLKTGGAG